jgi:hypothetical protein
VLHADVGQHELRVPRGRHLQGGRGVRRLADDFVAGLALDQRAHAFAHEGVVIDEQDAHGDGG